ncbi:MAG TPA: hypothetical protein VJ399_03260 [Patescibacteria group bacterium]|nr:hypothetical protein [Patescibacteria group bacterium]
MKRNSLIKGQSMFEVVFALGIIALITVAIVSVSTVAIRNNISAKNKSLSGKYLNEMNEWLRNERDKSFPTFYAHGSNVGNKYCIDEINGGWSGAHPGSCGPSDYIPNTTFLRGFTLTTFTYANSQKAVSASAYVQWNDAQGFHEARSVTVYTDWE